MSTHLKSKIQSAFQMNGFCLRSSASRHLIETLSAVDEVRLEDILDKIIEGLQKHTLSSNIIEQNDIEKVLTDLQHSDSSHQNPSELLEVINVFNLDKYRFNSERKKFIKEADSRSLALFGSADDKANLFRDRYNLIHQRVMRHDIFTPAQPGMNEDQGKNKFKLSPIEFLRSCTTKVKGIIVLGMITEMKEGKYYLEDPTGCVLMDRTNTMFHKGLVPEGTYVLAEGSYEDGVFYVSALGVPPIEPAKITRAYFGNLNMFGSRTTYSSTEIHRLKMMEEGNRRSMFIILSDVWLDQSHVLDKLRVLFSGYYKTPPTCFIFCGDFNSKPYGPGHVETTRAGFLELANIISHYPTIIKESRFIFVPGPADPGACPALPRPPLPHVITRDFMRKIPNTSFTSNPCHIQYCSQQVVVLRGDGMRRMCRNTIHFPEKLEDLPSLYIKTLISQSHLNPLPLHKSPTFWNFDHSLYLYPIPDLLITAERADNFTVDNADYHCLAVNPGSFSQNHYCFQVYWPASKKVEDSQIQGE